MIVHPFKGVEEHATYALYRVGEPYPFRAKCIRLPSGKLGLEVYKVHRGLPLHKLLKTDRLQLRVRIIAAKPGGRRAAPVCPDCGHTFVDEEAVPMAFDRRGCPKCLHELLPDPAIVGTQFQCNGTREGKRCDRPIQPFSLNYRMCGECNSEAIQRRMDERRKR